MPVLYLLYEAATGYSVFEVKQMDELQATSDAVQQTVLDIARFGKVLGLTAFQPFSSAAEALEQINALSESQLTDELKAFLEMSLPKVKKGKEGKEGKKAKLQLGVADAKLGSAIQEELGIPCLCNEFVGELLRGVRQHANTFMRNLEESDVRKSQLGLAHSYSRAKVKFNVNRVDNMIIQAIALLDTLDKDINTFVMRVREWYSWHFPELLKIASDNYQYSRLALLIRDKTTLTEEKLPEMAEILGDEDKAKDILEASKSSMGQDISEVDHLNIQTFAQRVISLAQYRHRLHGYLLDKMHIVAPNLSALIGEVVGARLISHAGLLNLIRCPGSLNNLAKYPASTVQILGAEKALFRALKTKGNTPKYGLIFHSSFIGRAKQRNKGRISRYLANKCSIASRIDCYMDLRTAVFGEKLKEQVEERLKFYEDGVAPTKNMTAMQAALAAANGGDEVMLDVPTAGEKKKKKKKRSMEAAGIDNDIEQGPATEELPVLTETAKREGAVQEEAAAAAAGEAPKKKKKKSSMAAADAEATAPETQPKKKKKKKKADA